ncbi:MAG TPA: PspC domain-containing protein [Mycobacteriales bacterium]|nr:PspC domain-containing protein [Mycobacteriales bacterium]
MTETQEPSSAGPGSEPDIPTLSTTLQSEPPQAPPGAAAPPPGPTAAAPRHRITRSTSDKMIAGVCGGLARATNTDPILYRVLLGVLLLFGGVGALIYLVAWLLLPADGDSASPVGALLGQGQSATKAALTAVLVGVAGLMVIWSPVRNFPSNFLLIAVLALLGYLAFRTRNAAPAPPVPPPSPTAPLMAPSSGPVAGAASPPPFAAPPTTSPQADPGAPVPKPKKSGITLGRLTLAAICLVEAVMIVLDLLVADIPVSVYFSVAMAGTGLGLIAGAWFGHARWLTALVVVLGLGLGASLAAAHISDNTIRWQASSIQDLNGNYNAGGGGAALDLRNLRLDSGVTKDVNARLAAGTLTVRLPRHTGYQINANVGMGSLDVLDKHSDGADLHEQGFSSGDTQSGTITLDLTVGAGNVKVTA